MIRRLRVKFICTNMAIVFVMLCIILFTVLYFTQNNLEQATVSFMQGIARDPLQIIRPGEEQLGIQLPYFSIEVGEEGQIIAANGSYYSLDNKSMLQDITARSLAAAPESGILREYNLRYYRVSTPDVQRIVFTDVSGELSTMSHMLHACLAIGVASLILFFLISLVLSNWAVKPVAEAWERQKRFVSDASHELKTPLSLISLNVELLSNSAEAGALPQKQLGYIQSGAARMSTLVENLLELARTDNGIPQKQMANFDFSRMVYLSALSAEAFFVERRQRLVLQLTPEIIVHGSQRHIDQLVTILLDNAHKYGREGGIVTVTLTEHRYKHCLLCVRNTGEPIPKQELRRIFNRFYRRDESRAADGSYGLGLSIAKNIVQEHRGRIWAESTDDENLFYVLLPLKKLHGKK